MNSCLGLLTAKNSGLKHSFLWAEINFLYLHSRLKIQMLVSNSSGYMPSKISDKFPNFCHSLWPGAAPSAVQSCFPSACSGDRTCCFVQVVFGTRLPDTHEKHLCEPGWPLAGLAGWAEVEAVLANRAFFRINVLCLGYQTNPCVFVKAPLCKQTNTTQCSWLLSNTEVFLSVPGKKTVISFCLHFISGSLSWCETVGLAKSRGWLLGGVFPSLACWYCLCSWDAAAVTTFSVDFGCFFWHWRGWGLLSQARLSDSTVQ